MGITIRIVEKGIDHVIAELQHKKRSRNRATKAKRSGREASDRRNYMSDLEKQWLVRMFPIEISILFLH